MNLRILRKRLVSAYIVLAFVMGGFAGLLVFEGGVDDTQAATLYVGSGQTYTSIGAAIIAANNGDTIRVYAGIYYENIVINKVLTLIGNVTSNTTINGGGNGNVVLITADWVNVSNFYITNSGSGAWRAGIKIDTSDHIKIENCNSSNNNFGIHLASASSCEIINNSCFNNSKSGIRLGASSYCTLINNTWSSNDDADIYLANSIGIILINNTLLSNGFFIRGSSLQDWNTHTINTSNIVNGNPVYYWKNIMGGTIPFGAGQIILANCTNVIVENQNFSDNFAGVELGYSNSNYIKNNTCNLCMIYGIYLYESSYNVIENNICLNSWISIQLLSSSDGNQINNNYCANNSRGLGIEYSDANTINYNSYINNSYESISCGIYLGNTIGSVIQHNNFLLNLDGITVYDTINTNISKNTYESNNDKGIYLHTSTSNNRIYHNNFITNPNQAGDSGINNIWNNLQLEGNYWSDYAGFDNGAGGRIAGDGIGDTNIPHRSLDNYPLMEPWPLPPSIVYVDDDFTPFTAGWGIDHFNNINDGINNVTNSGNVYVFNGTYYENVNVNKTLTLIGNGTSNTIIDAGDNGTTMTINSDNCTLTGFTITGSGTFAGDAGLVLNSDNNTIENCNISRNNLGIYLNNSDYNTIGNNTVGWNYGVGSVDDGLVGYWKMDEASWSGSAGEVKDSSGTGNNGTANGGVTTVSGRFGNAGDFDGINDYINCGTDPSLNMGTSDITIEVWVKITKTGSQQQIIRKSYGTAQSGQGRWIVGISNSNKVRIVIEDQAPSYKELIGNKIVTDNKWHLISTVFDRDDMATIYIDGTYDSSTSISAYSGSVNNDRPCVIGCYLLGNTEYFGGLIDEARIYNRSLSQEEIYNQYLNGFLAGINIHNSNNNIITDNIIENSSNYAIRITNNSALNSIYHNYILYNNNGSTQASDDGSNNNWDNGSIGNYWSDWLSPDYNAPQGIVDLSYNIAGSSNSNDNYPICPWIDTPANLTAYEDVYYQENNSYHNTYLLQDWSLSTNATWLTILPNGTIEGNPTNWDVGFYWLNATLTDYCTTIFENITIEVININDPPIITTSNLTIAWEDELYYRDYDAYDIDPTNDILTWSLDTNASFLVADSNTGNLSGLPVNADVGSYWVNITVSDGKGGIDFVNFTLVVGNINNRPEILTADIIWIDEDEFYYNDYEANDIDPTNDIFTWTLDTMATFLDMDADTGELSGTPDNDDVGTYDVNITLSDNRGGFAYREFILTVNNINDAPTITGNDITVTDEDELYHVDYGVVDVDVGDTIFTWELNSNASWLTIDEDTGELSGTPTNDDVGLYDVNVTVTDGHNGYDYREFILTVRNVNDDPVWVDVPSDVVLMTKLTYTFDANASDVDPDDTELQYGITSNPASSIAIEPNTGIVQWIPSDAEVGAYTIILSVTDGDVTIYHEYTIQVISSFVNTPPTATLDYPGDASKLIVLTPTLGWMVEDLDGDTVIVDVYFSINKADIDGLNPAKRIGPLTDQNYTFTDPLERGTTYYWTAVPHDGTIFGTCTSGVWSFSILELVNSPPEFTSIPELAAEVGIQWTYTPVAIDPDGDVVTILLLSGLTGMTLNNGVLTWIPTVTQLGGFNQVRLEATDGIGAGTQDFMITVTQTIVNQLPSINPIPDQTTKVGEQVSLKVTAIDPDGDLLTYAVLTGPSGAEIRADGSFLWTPTKAHVGEQIFVIQVSDSKGIANGTFKVIVEDIDAGDVDTGKEGMSDTQLILLILMIIIVVIVALVAVMMRFKKAKAQAAAVPTPQVTDTQAIQVTIQKPSDVKVITPVTVTPSVKAITLTPVPSPTIGPSAPLTVPKIELLPAGPKSFDMEAPPEPKEGTKIEAWDLKEEDVGVEETIEESKVEPESPEDVAPVESPQEVDSQVGGEGKVEGAEPEQGKVEKESTEQVPKADRNIDDLFGGL